MAGVVVPEPVCDIVLRLVVAARAATEPAVQRWMRTLLTLACRQLEFFVTPAVSAAAAAEAERRGLAPLHGCRRCDQPGSMSDRSRAVFRWEHVFPVAEMKRELLKPNVLTVADVRSVMQRTGGAWILKPEDRELTRRGHAHDRPKPAAADAEAGIVLTRFGG